MTVSPCDEIFYHSLNISGSVLGNVLVLYDAECCSSKKLDNYNLKQIVYIEPISYIKIQLAMGIPFKHIVYFTITY